MSSPASSLKKLKRSPLSRSGRLKVGVPFRQSDEVSSESPLPIHPPSPDNRTLYPLDSHIQHSSHENSSLYPLDSHTHKTIIDGLRHSHSTGPKGLSSNSDTDLLVSMAHRLSQVERQVLSLKRELIEKNEYIRHLTSKLSELESSQNRTREEEVQYLHEQCRALQDQVDDMEEFLNDYGMVWVGKGSEESHDKHMTNNSKLWSQKGSLPLEQVDFDLIIKNIKDLNVLAGEGSSAVSKTSKGAKLEVLETVPLTLYNNGLCLFAGPFRPYCDPSTQQVVRDLTDGYFPSELRSRYPEGVPLTVNDQRDVVYTQRSMHTYFPGSGHTLGGHEGHSRLVTAGATLQEPPPVPQGLRQTSELAVDKISMEQFLSNLPSSVLKGGRVLSIRSDIRERLMEDSEPKVPRLRLVDTEVVEEMKSRLELAECERPPTPYNLTTLRVKTEDGEQTYILKMKHTETVGDVRNYINKIRGSVSPSDYLLKTTFPSVMLTDLSATLRQCGLVPSATLYMAARTHTN